ncbi:uncharacterized protein MYCGRDRAFT_35535 [Zymoseptoria tritici IPO323]|uniref:Uncharacterized protein n=1 Tax=Zymoseptoria tritici (strain CBS 115943 / IPO323) TaxID=336722 RepID=F9X2Q8_ZYMTI|nr:uncharacterized protein MYCGRDRAFT_35535 [Zymoseptoria tritici IPO323]EGP89809.1 hypothetical protein MYCGRDRAFT_35535 [Zymoseptoria tritici IPO323]
MYAGESRPELEDAWDDLMRAEVFRATAEDLSLDDEAVNDAVTLEHGGYLASLSVYHALHCIEWIKRNYARAHTIDELHGKEGHLDHCLYFIRESVTCRADVTINSFHWGEDSDVPLSLPGKERPCVDLAAVREWILERALKPGERAVHTNGSLGAPHNKYRFEMPEG